jgi:hypothetical protein
MTIYQNSRLPAESWFAWTLLLRWMVPLAFGIMLAGCVISLGVRTEGWPREWDDLILSDLASKQSNPNGWLVAVVSTTLGGILLLAAAASFIWTFKRLPSRWGTVGAFFYCLGVLAIITWAVSTPLTEEYSSFHVNLSYFAYMSSVGGLGICHTVIALMSTPRRLLSIGSGFLLSATFLVLLYFFFHDEIFDHYLWLLAVTEWVAGFLIALTTADLAFGVVRLLNSRKNPD